MKKKQTYSIPTDEEFEHASELMAAKIRKETRIKKRIISICEESEIFHDVYVWISNGKCQVDLFLKTKKNIQTDEAKELKERISSIIIELTHENNTISVELDSDERIQNEFNGNYFYALR